jgi:beta-mannosidase
MNISLNGSDWQILGLAPSEWVWRKVGGADTDLDNLQPAAPPWIPATVPGDVQSDLEDAGEIPDWRRDLNSRACEWTSQRDWVYRKEFDVSANLEGKTVRLRFEGVDYACHVFLNGHPLGGHEGTYTPFEFEATDRLIYGGRNRLIVVVEHAPSEPEVQGQIGWTSRVRRWKPRFAYGWDWCTRLIPLGIVDDVSLIVSEEAQIKDVWVRPELASDYETGKPSAGGFAAIWVTLDAPDGFEGVMDMTLYNPDGALIGGPYDGPVFYHTDEPTTMCGIGVDDPLLWWPNGSGEQPLYRAHLVLKSMEGRLLDERMARFGFRQVRAVPNEDAPEGALPYVLEVNGVKTFIKGWNWAPIDQLYGRPHEQQYRHVLRMAKEAHCNLLRVWGGGLLERELFYDLCDEAGLMVWQEFFQSSSGIDNEPAADPEYVACVRDQARQIAPRRRNHPCLVLWCGGNELMTPDWKPIGNDHPAIAALKEVVEELDPGRLFLPTSPSGPVFAASPDNKGRMHDVHGHWLYMGDPEHYRFYNEIDPLLHSEFGAEGAANLPALKRFLSEKYLWPPDRTNPAWVHHGSWWLNRPTVEKLFGPIDNIEDFVKASQWIQAEGLRYGVEANRRRKWRTAGTMPWQFNETWPNASGTYVLDYYGHPKPAYWAVRSAYAPYLVSAQYDRLVWQPGEEFRAKIWVNASKPLPGDCELVWQWYDALSSEQKDWNHIPINDMVVAPRAVHVCEVSLPLPKDSSIFALHLMLVGQAQRGKGIIACNEYLFSTLSEMPFASLLRAPKTRLTVGRLNNRNMWCIENDIRSCFGLQVDVKSDYTGPYPNQGYWMFVHAGCALSIHLPEPCIVTISAWNADPVEVDIR